MHFKFKIKNSSKGITLVELVVVVFLIVAFSMILISDFPTIQKQFALSRVTYKLAQDLRRTEDLGLSGVPLKDSTGNTILVSGYGIYINTTQPATKYIIYADVKPNSITLGNNKYDGDFSTSFCSSTTAPTVDCVIEIVDLGKENSSLYIGSINNTSSNFTSINFSPPNPTTTIDNISSASSPVGIILSNGSTNRTVQVNNSGLINIFQ